MRRPPAPVALLLVAALVVLGVVLDARRPSQATDRPPPVRAGAATSGAWYCAAGDTQGGDSLHVVAASPPSPLSQPSVVRIDSLHDGTVGRTGEDTQVFPDSSFARAVTVDEPGVAVAARWWERPAAISRVWEMTSPGGPTGYVTGPCEPGPSPTWIIPGVATAGGAQAVLYLANPFESDASLSIEFTTSDGTVAPRLLENVVVSRHSVKQILLNQYAPEMPDLGVVVHTRSGRIVAEAVQTFNAAIGGVDGTSLVKAARAPAETWTIPWLADRQDTATSWLWITNTNDQAASVALSVHTKDGGAVSPPGLEEITVDPHGVQRVDLQGVVPGSQGGLTVRSDNGVPIVASVATEFTTPPSERTGLSVQLGAPRTDASWVLAGGPTNGRQILLRLVNPRGETARVDVSLWSATGVLRPDDLQGVEIPPGGWTSLDLGTDLPAADHFSAFVTAEEGEVVAGLEAYDVAGPRRLVATLGVPASVWAGGQIVPPVEYVPGFTQRVGTSLGPSPAPTGVGTELPVEPTAVPTDVGTDVSTPPPTSEPAPTEPASTEPAPTEPSSTEPAPTG